MVELPEGYVLRPATAADLPAVVAVVTAEAAESEDPDVSEEHLRGLVALGTPEVPATWLVSDPAGAAVGWAFVRASAAGDRVLLRVHRHPGAGLDLYRPLLPYLLDRAAAVARAHGRPELVAETFATGIEKEYRAAAAGVGFRPARGYLRLNRDLDPASSAPDLAPEPPALPDGVAVVALDAPGAPDLAAFHATLAAACADAPEHPTPPFEAWRQRALAAAPDFSEWLLATVDGQPAGALESLSAAASLGGGWLYSFGVRPQYRRRRIGSALLHAALAAYARNGKRWAGCEVVAGTPGAAVCTTVGMRPLFTFEVLARTVAAEHTLSQAGRRGGSAGS